MIPARSSSAETEPVLLRRTGPYRDRISVFRRLFDDGVTARAAKDAIDALASDDLAVCPIPGDTDMVALARDLARLDVQVQRRRLPPAGPDFIVDIRNRHRLSQREFADRLGVDVRTLQNWEQGRNRPDQAVVTLMRVFDENPALLERAAFEPVL
jgi:putative transcriptional regulator